MGYGLKTYFNKLRRSELDSIQRRCKSINFNISISVTCFSEADEVRGLKKKT